MSFEVAIYNAGCDDGKRVIDSVKAAYLYADKVRVYDYLYPNGLEDLAEKRKVRNRNVEKQRWLRDIAQAKKAYRLKTMKETMKGWNSGHLTLEGVLNNNSALIDYCNNIKDLQETLLDELNVAASETCLYVHAEIINSIQEAREQKSKLYSRIKYQMDLKQMGIEWIEPDFKTEIISEEFPSIIKVLDDFDDRFWGDTGYKLFNNYSTDPKMKTSSPSIFIPSYLSEYAISKLPGFEYATLDEMIDIREELDAYIIPYREAIVALAQEIKEVPDSESLEHECASIYLTKIEPKVAEINAAIRDNNVIRNIFRSALKSELGWNGIGAIAAAIATRENVASSLGIASTVALGGYSITNGISTTINNEEKIQKNEMYFLYEAGEILEN